MANQTRSVLKSDFKNSYKKEILFVLLSALFLFISIAVFSFNSNDNTLFHFSNQSKDISNLAGFIGANLAVIIFYLLGTATYILLFGLATTLYLLFSTKNLRDIRSRFFWLTLFFLVSTAFLGIISQETSLPLSSGIFGKLLTEALYTIAGINGSIVAVLALLWISTASFLQLPLFPYLNAGLQKLKILAAPYIKFALKFKLSNLNPLKLLLRKKTEKNEIVIPAADMSKEIANDIEYWKGILEKPQNEQTESQEEIKVTQSTQTDTIASKFENKKLRNKSEDITCSKFTFTKLPNTVLTKNIFTKQSDGSIPYNEILKAEEPTQKPKQIIEFELPETKIFAIHTTNENLDEIDKESAECGKKLEEKLLCFGVKGKVVSVKPGPVITMYEYKPEIDSKISKITAVEDDLAMALTAKSIRILAPIPGKNVVGFEISNKTRQDVYFSDAIPSTGFKPGTAKLPLMLGVDVTGKPVIEDLSKMPHLLVGGATGSGKSVGLHSMIVSLLCHLNPDQLKLVLVDPKRLEFGTYSDIPHLLFPIVTNPETAISSLKWVVQEMERRYLKMASCGARNISEYQEKAVRMDSTSPQVATLTTNGENKTVRPERSVAESNGYERTNLLTPMPYIVVIIDELADLMMVGGKDLEMQIVRIAQMARAAGIHMIVATQRPSVEVVTGLIKVNFPSRISFRVSSKIDSRTVLDSSGAEKLLGRGDMLFMNSSSPELLRAHGVYVSDKEIKVVAEWWKNQQGATYLNLHEELKATQQERPAEQEDEIYDQVIEFIQNNDEVSISLLQRYFRIGFNRSARLIEKLEMDGLISPAQGGCKTRKVLR